MKLLRFQAFESAQLSDIPSQIDELDLEYSITKLAELSSTIDLFTTQLVKLYNHETGQQKVYQKPEMIGRLSAIQSFIYLAKKGLMLHEMIAEIRKVALEQWRKYRASKSQMALASAVTYKQLYDSLLRLYQN